MPYRNLECDNEKTYRWHTVDDIKKISSPIIQSILKDVKKGISHRLMQIKGVDIQTVKDIMDSYTPKIIGIQMIHCEACEQLQIDVIVNSKTKVREDLWRAYETDRFVKQFVEGKQW